MLLKTILIVLTAVTSTHQKYHCSDHITLDIEDKVKRLINEHEDNVFTGYLDPPSKANLIPIKLTMPPPCGVFTTAPSDLDRFHKTAIQVYRFDPTASPHVIMSVTAVRLTTVCVSHWVGRDEKTISKEVVSTFDRLPQDEFSIVLNQLDQWITTLEVGEERLELLNQDIYDCPTWVNPGTKKTYVLRIKLHRSCWSPTGFLVSPYLLRNCSISDQRPPCIATPHTMLYWSKGQRNSSPLFPSITMGGILETSSRSKSNALCPGVVRFFSLSSDFELTFSVDSIASWEPETYINGKAIFVSSEGIFFTFLDHDGRSLLIFLCPSWKFEQPSQGRRPRGAEVRFSSEVPLEFQSQTLEEEVSWMRARIEGHLSNLYNRTVKELITLHQKECERKRLLAAITIGLTPLDPRPYLIHQLGHYFFEVIQIGKRRYYKTASPVNSIEFDFRNSSRGHIFAHFNISGIKKSGYFSCKKGYFRFDIEESEEETSTCYLHVHGLGGIDLCSASTTPSSYDGPREGDWIPRVEVPVLKLLDESYGNELEDKGFSYLGPRDFLQSMGHSLLHEYSRWPSVSSYTAIIDNLITWLPYIVTSFIFIKVVCCCVDSPVSERVKSRVF